MPSCIPNFLRSVMLAGLVSGLAACGGGSSTAAGVAPAASGGTSANAPSSDAEAVRFLNQATFGVASEAEIRHLREVGYDRWFDEQFAKPQRLHMDWQRNIVWKAAADHIDGAVDPAADPNVPKAVSSFYTQAVLGDDQLRQRMAWALSQTFVVSGLSSGIGGVGYGSLMSWPDLLGRDAFADYRTLVSDMTRNPLMALMLSYIEGRREEPATGTFPDQNYARELMQLFSIGLVELEPDGRPKPGSPSTYDADDIQGLAKAVTGWYRVSYASADGKYDALNNSFNAPLEAKYDSRSYSEKRFLGAVIPARAQPASVDLEVILDTITTHPNVAPFLSRQLIQRFVTSNPSHEYVARVAKVWTDNGQGQRGDFKAVIKAILLDPEARNAAAVNDPTWGKVREPVLRTVHMLRLVNATGPHDSIWGGTVNQSLQLCGFISDTDQVAYHSPTVFNYYRPGFVPPFEPLARLSITAPELQIYDSVSSVNWSELVEDSLTRDGFGWGNACRRDTKFDYSAWLPFADSAEALVGRVNLFLFAGQLPTDQRARMVAAVASVNSAPLATQRINRVKVALMLALNSPQYLVQK